jgi:hypothetical protein
VKVGDLIELKRPSIRRNEDRFHGYILKFETYKSLETNIPEKIVHVYWDTGNIGWILASRVEVISESR